MFEILKLFEYVNVWFLVLWCSHRIYNFSGIFHHSSFPLISILLRYKFGRHYFDFRNDKLLKRLRDFSQFGASQSTAEMQPNQTHV